MQTVDFTKLDMATLKRYKRHYRLKTRQNVTKTELALAVAKHFASQHVDEVCLPPRRLAPALQPLSALMQPAGSQAETIQLFVYSARSSTLQYGLALPIKSTNRPLPRTRVCSCVAEVLCTLGRPTRLPQQWPMTSLDGACFPTIRRRIQGRT